MAVAYISSGVTADMLIKNFKVVATWIENSVCKRVFGG